MTITHPSHPGFIYIEYTVFNMILDLDGPNESELLKWRSLVTSLRVTAQYSFFHMLREIALHDDTFREVTRRLEQHRPVTSTWPMTRIVDCLDALNHLVVLSDHVMAPVTLSVVEGTQVLVYIRAVDTGEFDDEEKEWFRCNLCIKISVLEKEEASWIFYSHYFILCLNIRLVRVFQRICVILTHAMKMVVLVHLFWRLILVRRRVKNSFCVFQLVFAWSSHHEDGGIGTFLTAYLVRRRVWLVCVFQLILRDPHTMKMVVLVHFWTTYLVRRWVVTQFAYFSWFAWSSHHEDGGVGAFVTAFDPHTMKMVVLVRRCRSSTKKREQGPTVLYIHRSRWCRIQR